MDVGPRSRGRVPGHPRQRLSLLVVLILGCAGCGDDSNGESGDDSSDDAGDPPGATLPAAPTELHAGTVTDTSISLRWSDNADNETGFEIERRLQTGTIDDYEQIGTVGADSVSYLDTVEPETDYLYRVRATNSAGNSDYAEELAVSSLVTPVLAPSDLTVQAVTDARVELAWTDNADNETEYRVERGDTAATYAVIATLAADSASYIDNDVSSSTTYTYRVRAASPKTASSYSNEVQATTASAAAPTEVFARLQSTDLGSQVHDVLQTQDGGYVFVGSLDVDDSLVTDNNLLVVKLDPTGAVDWTRGFDAPSSDDNHGFGVEATPDGGYIVTGIVNIFSDVWVLKLDASGDIEWEAAYGTGADRFGYAVTTVDADADGVPDDGYIVVGTAAVPRASALVIRLDLLGNVLWQRTYDTGTTTSTAYSVQQTAAGNFIIAGEKFPEPFRSSFWVVKLDPSGGTIWQRSYGLLEAGEEGIAKALSVRQVDDDGDGAADDGFIVAGYADILPTSAFSYDVWVLKLTTAGDIVWQKRYGDPALEERVADAEVDSDGNLVIADTAMGELLLLKIDDSGKLLLQRTFGGISSDAGEAIDVTTDGGVVMLGNVRFEVGQRDGWILKLDASADIQFVPGNVSSTEMSFVGVDTATIPVDTAVMPFMTIVPGQPMNPSVVEPTIKVTTQSQ